MHKKATDRTVRFLPAFYLLSRKISEYAFKNLVCPDAGGLAAAHGYLEETEGMRSQALAARSFRRGHTTPLASTVLLISELSLGHGFVSCYLRTPFFFHGKADDRTCGQTGGNRRDITGAKPGEGAGQSEIMGNTAQPSFQRQKWP